ncbi:hypothetical protein GLOTRDRAFT_50901 [Gloeophyllum trabeum ATCC 11539]|uniref:Uncharacterized protein n=1 Tax=Gloeophyllum trabeum (strain ATCC 11539 / FP-39264 / Madison 617) TaxID=670483 RepID=S7R747_GLOTA|nr:uncharacterized protein GLOTRDRAFT_50901 [Gloeophyllum trabeum ATCC 11539]EPQ50210.1 hypothetical protein GLOTRDRAFT_50901 [Gloeophyllum trabeum ATCC 11539]
MEEEHASDHEDGANPNTNPFFPFSSEVDWRVARWAVEEGPGQKAFDRFLAIPEIKERLGLSFDNTRGIRKIVDSIPPRAPWKSANISLAGDPGQKHLVQYRDPVALISSLLSNPAHASSMVYAPKKVYTNSSKSKRAYSEMWTGKWWHAVQVCISAGLPIGSTVAPIIISTDKTQLTQFSGSKQAYPIYLTIGNLPRSLRRRPSEHATMLLGYLSTDKIISSKLSKEEKRKKTQRLFHESMRHILKPLKDAGQQGVEMICGDGAVRRVHPILACYVADYPEQILVTCSKSGTCPKCRCRNQDLGDPETSPLRTKEWTTGIMSEARSETTTDREYSRYCMNHDVSGAIQEPFWQDFPFCDIHICITPDVLHQLYQGVFKHILEWCTSMMDEKELDRRIRSFPPGCGVRIFKNGISTLSQISGTERKNMAKVLLGCLVGKLPEAAILAVRALLDFIYQAQNKTHDDDTLAYLTEALDLFHSNKHVFIEVGIRDDFNIPKFHSLLHYIDSIRLFGTTDNYNTEMFERLHIDFAKEGWRASNHRDERPQMVSWVERQEKMTSFDCYVEWRNRSGPSSVAGSVSLTSFAVKMAKRPAAASQALQVVELRHSAPGFTKELKRYLLRQSTLPQQDGRPGVQNSILPFNHIDVYYNLKLRPVSIHDEEAPWDILKALPAEGTKEARFDTIIAIVSEDAESTGLEGTRIGRVKIIFRLPKSFAQDILSPWRNEPLLYVEWFSPLRSTAGKNHMMYEVNKPPARVDGSRPGAILSLKEIRQTCQLIPRFGREDISPDWCSSNVLDKCSSFFVNNWASLYAYQTIW